MRKNLTYGDLHDDSAEQAVIGSILIDNEALLEVSGFLKPDHFRYEKNAEIYRACLQLFNNKKPLDLVTVLDQLKANNKIEEVGGTSYVADCINEVPTSTRIKHYAQIIIDYARRRKIIEAYEKVKPEIYDLKKDTDSVITNAENTILEAIQRPETEKLQPDSDKVKKVLEEIEIRRQFNKSGKFIGLDSGFSHLNEVTLGMQTGLWILGARPSLGKTTLLKQLIDQVAMNNQDALCLFVSYEQSSFELMLKTISRLSGINSREIQKGRLNENDEVKINEAIEKYYNHANRIYVLEADGAKSNIDVIKAKARQLLLKHDFKKIFIAIDYLQLVPASSPFKSDKERIDSVCSDLRRLARDLSCPVVAVSSLNRPAYQANGKGKADMSSFKESGGIEYSADLAITMDEEKTASQTLTMKKRKPMRVVSLRIHKNRNGERAKILFEFDMPLATFTELDKKELEDESETLLA
jgi:replicative DNA helicase